MQPDRSLPNPADQIRGFLSRPEPRQEGVSLDDLAADAVLEVETRHHLYQIKNLGDGRALISGHPDYCPEPMAVEIIGSSYGDEIPRLRFFGEGGRMEFYHPERGFIRTSRIMGVRELTRAV